MTDSQPDRPMAATDVPCGAGNADADRLLRIRRLLVFGSISVAIGLCFSNGHLDPFSLAAMTLAAWAGIGATLLGKRPSLFGTPGRLESWLTRSPERFLWWGILLSVAINAVLPPGYYADRARLGLFRPLLLLAGLLVLSYRRKVQPPILVRCRFPLFLVLAAAMSAVVMRASPRPAIDVWHVLQLGAEGLARGENPYTLEYPNIYAVTSQYVSKQFLSADGSQVIVHARGLGYEKYTAVWEILYDNRLMGWMSAFTSRGSVDVTVPVVGTPGTHSIDIHEGTGGWPYLNMQQSPWPWEPAVRFAFTIQAPAPATQATAVNVPLWLTGAAIVAAVAVGFLAGRVRRRSSVPPHDARRCRPVRGQLLHVLRGR